MNTTETDCQKSLRIAQERANRLSARCRQLGAELNVLAAETEELRAENAAMRALIEYTNEENSMDNLKIPGDVGDVSDGYHTFNELYAHRCHLFAALMRAHPDLAWRANNHADGSNYAGWFVAGMHLPTGDISYHLPANMWEMLDGCGIETSALAPEWDGHTSADVVARLAAWCRAGESK